MAAPSGDLNDGPSEDRSDGRSDGPRGDDEGERPAAHRLVGLLFLSSATLLLELSLTRVLSVALWYHFGFLVISTALLGFGAAGITLAAWPALRDRARLDRALAELSLAFAACTVASFWLMQHVPLDPFRLLSDRRQLLWMPLYDLALASPFYCAGLAISLLFTRGAKGIGRLYAFDLVGAGLGCGAVALSMPLVGGSGSILVAALLGAIGAAIFALPANRSLAAAALAAVVALAGFARSAERLIPVRVSPGKVLPWSAPGGGASVLATRWNTFSRIDVVEGRAADLPGRPLRRMLLIDQGTAMTSITDLRPDVRQYLARHEGEAFESGVAYVGKERPRVLVLGSGAGAEVLGALGYGASSIVAVEINPIINELVTGPSAAFWGGLFEQPEVRLVTDEARSFVRRSRDQFDAIVSAHTVSNAAVASGAISLAENYVLTREAFEDYLDKLAPDGTIYFSRPEAQLPRLFATAREAFEARGLPSPAANVFAFCRPPTVAGRKSFGCGFVVRKTPLSEADLTQMAARAGVGRRTGPGAASEVVYSPLDPHPGSLYERLLTAPDVRAVYDAEPTLIAPATDDRPFFNQRVRWSSLTPALAAQVFRQSGYLEGRTSLEDRPVAEVTLLAVLAQSLVIAALFILVPLWRSSRSGLRAPGALRYLAYFGGLGVGFIFIEIALLQRFTLFLGQPVYTLAAVLGGLLVSSGVGAWLSGRSARAPRALAARVVPLVIALLALTALVTPSVLSAALGLALPLRTALAVLALAPLGVALGMPFPIGLRAVQREAPALVPWAWGVNCFFTVIGSVSAIILGMALGFVAVLALAAIAYGVALAAMRTTRT